MVKIKFSLLEGFKYSLLLDLLRLTSTIKLSKCKPVATSVTVFSFFESLLLNCITED